MDEEKIDAFLKWSKTHSQYLLLVEPTYDLNTKSGREEFIDKDQQMFRRHLWDYYKKFQGTHQFSVLDSDQFSQEHQNGKRMVECSWMLLRT